MLKAMRKILEEESRIEVAAEASTLAKTVEMIDDFKPEVLLLNLHMPKKRNFTPAFVKSQHVSVGRILAVSFSDDETARTLAESYGAVTLLESIGRVPANQSK